jgi:hypothetical protein
MTEYSKADVKAAEALFAERRKGFKRRKWGDATICTIATTQPDAHGFFQVGLVDHDELAWDSVTCNVNDDPGTELSEVLSLFAEHYADIWQAERHKRYNREGWRVPPGGRALRIDDEDDDR